MLDTCFPGQFHQPNRVSATDLGKTQKIPKDLNTSIMQCITSVTYYPLAVLFLLKGYGQGDPLFPYLFLLCAKGCSSLIKKSVNDGVLHGVAACKRGPSISHLFFANDNLIFCKASLEECDSLQRLIGLNEKASGQQLNKAKMSLFFSKNTPDDVREEFKSRFDAQVIHQDEKYLSLPLLVGRSKRNSFLDLKEKFG